jgi:hypothetical protein
MANMNRKTKKNNMNGGKRRKTHRRKTHRRRHSRKN